ncbi:MAG: hypothetical protein HY097_02635 [Nitrospinae bacterium]|nr:hypothetical protein [Nitrospinota bacterium]MBI3814142.1 hypothetical protein [Nitrospinota bacterium]
MMRKNIVVFLLVCFMVLPIQSLALDDNSKNQFFDDRSDNPWYWSLEKLTDCVKKQPDHMFCFLLRGEVYQRRGDNIKALSDYTEAIRICDKAKKENKESELLKQGKGACGIHRETLDKHIREINGVNENVYTILELTKKIEQNPTYAMLYRDRACEYGRVGDKFNGLKDLNKALQLCEDGVASDGVICSNFIPLVKESIEAMQNKGVCWYPKASK